MLAEYCESASEKSKLYRLASRNGRLDFEELIARRLPLTELLAMFPSCRPPLAHLLQELPPQTPRYYSIACSQSECPTTLNIALTIVQSTFPKSRRSANISPVVRKGLCSNWLLRVAREAGFVGKIDPLCSSSPPNGNSLRRASASSTSPEPALSILRPRHLPTIPSCQGCWRDRQGLV